MCNLAKCPYCGANKIPEDNTPWIIFECGTKRSIKSNCPKLGDEIKRSDQCVSMCKAVSRYKDMQKKLANKGLSVSFSIQRSSDADQA